MFQFRRFPTYAYLIQRRLTEYCSAGFPHSEICGSRLMCSSPQLIAACHVLHRLLMPRHSPCALISLTSPEPISGLRYQNWFSRIMQAQIGVIVVCVTLFLKSPQIYFDYLSAACFAISCLLCSVFKVQVSNLSQGQIETFRLPGRTLRFDLVLWWR